MTRSTPGTDPADNITPTPGQEQDPIDVEMAQDAPAAGESPSPEPTGPTDDAAPHAPMDVAPPHTPPDEPMDEPMDDNDMGEDSIPTAPRKQPTRATSRAIGTTTTKKPGKKTTGDAKKITAATAAAKSKGPADSRAGYINHVRPMFDKVLDDNWASLVAMFFEFEKSKGYKDERLRTGQRPPVLLNWVASRRPQLLDGVLSDKLPATVTLVRNEFWTWWRYLQPDWRELRQCNKPLIEADRQKTGNEWKSLNVLGTNGLVNVMVYLCMWGMKVVADGTGHPAWQDALVDVRWVIEQMSTATS